MLLEEPSLLVFVIVADNCIHYGDSKRQSFTSPSFGTTNHVLSLHCWLKNSSLNRLYRLQNRRQGSNINSVLIYSKQLCLMYEIHEIARN